MKHSIGQRWHHYHVKKKLSCDEKDYSILSRYPRDDDDDCIKASSSMPPNQRPASAIFRRRHQAGDKGYIISGPFDTSFSPILVMSGLSLTALYMIPPCLSRRGKLAILLHLVLRRYDTI
jgi:hypothetical protein